MRTQAPTLLVIEDTRDHAVLVGYAARRAHPGLHVHIADDGVQGIAYLAGTSPYEDRGAYPIPDLIILDLLMPEVDGFEVLEWIVDHPAPLHVPVVVLTAALSSGVAARCRALGASDVFEKPSDIVALGDVVRKIVEEWIGRSAIIGAHLWAAG